MKKGDGRMTKRPAEKADTILSGLLTVSSELLELHEELGNIFKKWDTENIGRTYTDRLYVVKIDEQPYTICESLEAAQIQLNIYRKAGEINLSIELFDKIPLTGNYY